MPGRSAWEARVGQEVEGKQGEVWEAFIVVSVGKNGQGKASRFKIGYFESFQQVLGCLDCPELFYTWS